MRDSTGCRAGLTAWAAMRAAMAAGRPVKARRCRDWLITGPSLTG